MFSKDMISSGLLFFCLLGTAQANAFGGWAVGTGDSIKYELMTKLELPATTERLVLTGVSEKDGSPCTIRLNGRSGALGDLFMNLLFEKNEKADLQFRAGADSFETYAAVKQTSKMECNIFCSSATVKRYAEERMRLTGISKGRIAKVHAFSREKISSMAWAGIVPMGPMVEGRDVVEEKTCLNMEIQGE